MDTPVARPTSGFNLPRYLSMQPLFQEMDAAELERLAQGCALQRHARGDMVFRVGEPCDAFHVTVTGQVKLFVISPAGAEKVIEIMGPGQSFAEALMFTGRPYILNAQALADSLVLHISKTAIIEELDSDPKLGRKMIAGLSMRLHQLMNDVESYSLHSGRRRIIGYLLRDHVDEHTSSIIVTLPTNKGVIASRLNLTQEHFSRILHDLSEKGLIVVEGRRIHIADVDALRAYDL